MNALEDINVLEDVEDIEDILYYLKLLLVNNKINDINMDNIIKYIESYDLENIRDLDKMNEVVSFIIDNELVNLVYPDYEDYEKRMIEQKIVLFTKYTGPYALFISDFKEFLVKNIKTQLDLNVFIETLKNISNFYKKNYGKKPDELRLDKDLNGIFFRLLDFIYEKYNKLYNLSNITNIIESLDINIKNIKVDYTSQHPYHSETYEIMKNTIGKYLKYKNDIIVKKIISTLPLPADIIKNNLYDMLDLKKDDKKKKDVVVLSWEDQEDKLDFSNYGFGGKNHKLKNNSNTKSKRIKSSNPSKRSKSSSKPSKRSKSSSKPSKRSKSSSKPSKRSKSSSKPSKRSKSSSKRR
jgi:hypothetical protein